MSRASFVAVAFLLMTGCRNGIQQSGEESSVDLTPILNSLNDIKGEQKKANGTLSTLKTSLTGLRQDVDALKEKTEKIENAPPSALPPSVKKDEGSPAKTVQDELESLKRKHEAELKAERERGEATLRSLREQSEAIVRAEIEKGSKALQQMKDDQKKPVMEIRQKSELQKEINAYQEVTLSGAVESRIQKELDKLKERFDDQLEFLIEARERFLFADPNRKAWMLVASSYDLRALLVADFKAFNRYVDDETRKLNENLKEHERFLRSKYKKILKG